LSNTKEESWSIHGVISTSTRHAYERLEVRRKRISYKARLQIDTSTTAVCEKAAHVTSSARKASIPVLDKWRQLKMADTVRGTAVNVRQSEGAAGSRKAELKFIYCRLW
jgi:hypothetical protein